MVEKGCLARGVAKVILGREAARRVKGLTTGRSRERWVERITGKRRYLRDFLDSGHLICRAHIHQTVATKAGLVVFLCLESADGRVIKSTLLSLDEMTKHVTFADLARKLTKRSARPRIHRR